MTLIGRLTLEELCAIAKSGNYSIDELAELADANAFTMRKACKRHGIPFRNRKFGVGATLKDEEKARLIDLFNLGMSMQQISTETGRCNKVVKAFLASQNLQRARLKGPGATLGMSMQQKLLEMIEQGESTAEIAEVTGLHVEYVRKVRRGLKEEEEPVKPAKKLTTADLWEIWNRRTSVDEPS